METSLDILCQLDKPWIFLMRFRGHSMAPLLVDGDILVVDRSLALNGDQLVIVEQGKRRYCRQLERVHSGTSIFGVVIWSLRKL